MQDKKLLSLSDVAEQLGLSEHTVYKYTQRRKISFIKVGSLLRFTQEDIDNYINAHRVGVIDSAFAIEKVEDVGA